MPFLKCVLLVSVLLVGGAGAARAQWLGDANRDGELDAADLVRISRHVSGADPLPVADQPFADLTRDDRVDELDRSAVADVLLGRRPAEAIPAFAIETPSPADGAVTDSWDVMSVSARFSLPVDPATLAGPPLTLWHGGPDLLLGTADDVPLQNGTWSYNTDERRLRLRFLEPVIAGPLRAEVSDALRSRFGRPLEGGREWTFQILPHLPYDYFEADPERTYRMKPDVPEFLITYADGSPKGLFYTNALGMRDPPPTPRRPGTLRVLVLGASYTFGLGALDVADPWPRRFEAVLNDENLLGAATEAVIMNGSVPAYTVFQQMALLPELARATDPDVLLLPFVGGAGTYNLNIFGRAGAYALWGENWLPVDQIERFVHGGFQAPREYGEDWPRANAEALALAGQSADALGLPMIVVYLPGLREMQEIREGVVSTYDLQEIVGDLCADHNLPYVAAREAVLARLDAETPAEVSLVDAWSVGPGDEHYNPAANRFIAQALGPLVAPVLLAAQ